MAQREDLPRPTSFNDMYMYDQCQSLRAIVDLLSVASSSPASAEPAADDVELREPEPAPKKATHRDAKRG